MVGTKGTVGAAGVFTVKDQKITSGNETNECPVSNSVVVKKKINHELTPALIPGWYIDLSHRHSYTGQAHIYKMEKILYEGKSEYQDILVFETHDSGRIAILDGSLQLSEKDECSYQEMMVHLPLCSIANPKKILVIGGGDGGLLREASRHSSLEQIDICELDKMIIEVYERFFPDIAIGFTDPRVNVHIGDGITFMKSVTPGTYDAIIVDAFDPIGPYGTEFNDGTFLEAAAKALRPGGVYCAPAESYWIKECAIGKVLETCRKTFKGSVNYAWTSVPSYESGLTGYVLCSTEGPPVNFMDPINPLSDDDETWFGVSKKPLKYYSSEMHRAAFCLPAFIKRAITNSTGQSS